MKEFLNIAQLQESVLAALKSIFNMDKRSMSTICIKVEKQKSPFEHFQRK